MNRKILIGLMLGALWSAACSRSGGSAPLSDASMAPGAPPKLSLGKDRKDLLFSYLDEDGRLRDVADPEQVPVDRRRQVLVRDLSMAPEALQADRFVFIADLTREEAGAFPYTVVSRFEVDRLVRDGDLLPPEELLDDAGQRRVVLYGTSWCGACAQARGWLRQHGVDFVDKDIEEDDAAQREMARKMKRAGLRIGGVPVLDVRGELMLGFDEGELARLLTGT